MSGTRLQKRREHKRVPCIKEVEIQDIGLFRSLEIGVGGMYIETVTSYPVGTILDLQFKLNKTDDRPIKVLGNVVYDHKCIGMGIRFLDLKPEDRERIEKFMEIDVASRSG
jgi:hypothetical protein